MGPEVLGHRVDRRPRRSGGVAGEPLQQRAGRQLVHAAWQPPGAAVQRGHGVGGEERRRPSRHRQAVGQVAPRPRPRPAPPRGRPRPTRCANGSPPWARSRSRSSGWPISSSPTSGRSSAARLVRRRSSSQAARPASSCASSITTTGNWPASSRVSRWRPQRRPGLALPAGGGQAEPLGDGGEQLGRRQRRVDDEAEAAALGELVHQGPRERGLADADLAGEHGDLRAPRPRGRAGPGPRRAAATGRGRPGRGSWRRGAAAARSARGTWRRPYPAASGPGSPATTSSMMAPTSSTSTVRPLPEVGGAGDAAHPRQQAAQRLDHDVLLPEQLVHRQAEPLLRQAGHHHEERVRRRPAPRPRRSGPGG